MSIIKQADLSKIRAEFKDRTIVYCSGTFDLTHAGHILFFDDCKNHGDILVVGVGPDHDIKINKSRNRPILNEKIRLFTISRITPVNYCFITKPMRDKNSPLELLTEIFTELKPDIYIVNEDAFEIPFRQKIASQCGVNLKILKRYCPAEFYQISTSSIIAKIKNLPD